LCSGGLKFTDTGNYGNIRSCIRAFGQGQASMSDHYDLPRRVRPAEACPSRRRPRSPDSDHVKQGAYKAWQTNVTMRRPLRSGHKRAGL
jgi:hypothetical protein